MCDSIKLEVNRAARTVFSLALVLSLPSSCATTNILGGKLSRGPDYS